jgi:hypothetical protein
MRDLELTVHKLLSAVQHEWKAKLDAGQVNTVFQMGDQVLLLTKELLDTADISKLLQLWDWHFTVMACPSPNAYTLALQWRMLCSLTVNVDRLNPFHALVDAPRAQGQVSDPGQEASTRWSCCSTARRSGASP